MTPRCYLDTGDPDGQLHSCHDDEHHADFPDVKKKSASAGPTRRIRRAASDMRAQALAAARRLIVQGSDEVLTMRAVADAAGVTYPNLSHHFGSAAGLHAAIAEDLVRELLAGLQTVGIEMDNLEHDYPASWIASSISSASTAWAGFWDGWSVRERPRGWSL